MTTISLRYEKRGLADIRPHPGNSKIHTPQQLDQIKRSIGRFGFNDPIGVLEDGTIVEGEGRWRAAQELGMTEVPVLVLSGMTERDADLYRIAHNKITLMTGFDMPKLLDTLRELTGSTVTLDDVGFGENSAISLTSALTGGQVNSPTDTFRRSAYVFDLVFDTDEQKARWNRFLAHTKKHHPSATQTEALILAIEEARYRAGGTEERSTVNV